MYTFKISPDDGTSFTVTANMRDVLAWERSSPSRSAQELVENFRLADGYEIAWRAAKRQKLYDGTRADFENGCDVRIAPAPPVDEPDDDPDGRDGSDPTRPAR